jgi:hypothetical protein
VDTKLGGLLGLFPLDVATDIAAGYQRKIDRGRVILIARMWIDAWSGDDTAALQILPGLTDRTLDATEDNLTGSGSALLAPQADRTAFLCGELGLAGYAAGPGPFVIPVPILGAITFMAVELGQATDATPMAPEALVGFTLGGGLTRATVENQLIPAMQLTINEEILDNPSGQTAQFVLATLDTACSASLPGCADVTPGSGDCAAWDHQPTTLPLSLTELRCNTFVRDVLAPDIDSDGDQVADLLSIGVRFDAIHITINN